MASVPAPWRPERRPRPPRKPPLSAEAIVAVALEIVDADGLEGLSMRRVAQRLDTGAASLYAHVASKEALIDHVVDEVSSRVRIPDPEPGRWREQVAESMRLVRDEFGAHRDLARALLGKVPVGPHGLAAAERFLALLRAGGLCDQVVGWGVDLLSLYAAASALEVGILHGTHADDPDAAAEYFQQVAAYFASLPTDRFPNFTSMVTTLTHGDADERFTFGVDVLLLGIEAYDRRLKASRAEGASRTAKSPETKGS